VGLPSLGSPLLMEVFIADGLLLQEDDETQDDENSGELKTPDDREMDESYVQSSPDFQQRSTPLQKRMKRGK
jgi:hypothetical protein